MPRPRRGWGRYTQRSRSLGGRDPRFRRDAQEAAMDALRGAAPIEVDRHGRTAVATEPDLATRNGRLGLDYGRVVKALPIAKRLVVKNGALDIKPTKAVPSLDSGATLADTVGKVNELLTAMRKAGLLEKKG